MGGDVRVEKVRRTRPRIDARVSIRAAGASECGSPRTPLESVRRLERIAVEQVPSICIDLNLIRCFGIFEDAREPERCFKGDRRIVRAVQDQNRSAGSARKTLEARQ